MAQHSDVVVVGAGAAGSLLALVLARRGLATTVVDLHERYPPDFRCEKLSAAQAVGLAELAVVDAVAGLTGGGPLTAAGFRYEVLVGALRGAWPEAVTFVPGRVTDLAAGNDLQTLTLADGRTLTARLVVLASGPTSRLAEPLGIRRRTLRRRHSFSVGFSLVRADPDAPPLKALSHQGERPGDGMGYASLFPLGEAMRLNLFTYRDPASAWGRLAQSDPMAALAEAMPALARRLGDVRVVGPVETRATDLYRVEGHVRPGVALIGDAFRSSCPATGMGLTRAISDVSRLAARIPLWLASPGMGADKIAAFYADADKPRTDSASDRRSERSRQRALDTSLTWRAGRVLTRLKRAAMALADAAA